MYMERLLSSYRKIVLISSLILVMSMPIATSAQEKAIELKVGETIKAKMAGGQSSSYELTLAEKSSVYLVVNQKGVDVVVRLFDPTGKKVFEIDSLNGKQGPEPIFWMSDNSAGKYRLEVSCEDKNAVLGDYEVQIKELRESFEEDKKLLLSQETFIVAERAWIAGENGENISSINLAIDKYHQVLNFCQELSLSKKYKDNKVSDEFDLLKQAYILNRLGQNSFIIEKYKDSIDFCEKSLAIYEKETSENEYILQKADCLANIGEAWRYLDDREKAANFYLKSIPLYKKIGNKTGELIVYNNLGVLYQSIQEKEALKYYVAALEIIDLVGNRELKAVIYANIGQIYETLDDHQKALDCYIESLNIRKETNNIESIAIVLSNLGILYDNLGDYKRALEVYDEAIKNFSSINKLVGKAKALVNKGIICEKIFKKNRDNNQLVQATKYYNEALEIFESKNVLQGKGSTLARIASIELLNKNYDKAISLLNNSLEIRRNIKDLYGEAHTNLLIGNVFTEKKDYKKASDYYLESLRLCREVDDRRGETTNLYYLADSEVALGNPEKAKELIENAINIVENSRLNVQIEKLRNTYLASSQSFYGLYVDVLMQLYKEKKGNYDVLAFEANEKSRARSLLETLAKSNSNIYNAIDPQLLSLERSQQAILDDKLNKLIVFKKENRSESDVLALENEIKNIRTELEQTESKIKNTLTVDVASKTQPLTLKSIQEEVLDSESVLLQYCLGKEKSYLWLVSKESLQVYELPNKETIEKLAEKVYRNITFRSQKAEFKFDTEQEKKEKILKADQKYQDSLLQLSQLVIKPAVKALDRKKRLIVVADGALRHIPFTVLPLLDEKVSSKLLVNQFDIVNLSSTSSLSILRKNNINNETENQKLIAIAADPIFDLNDERLQKSSSINTKKSEIAIRGVEQIDRSSLTVTRLPYTESEAQAIANLAPTGSCRKLVGLDASLTNVLSIMGDYKILHFATHGISNKISPELSGILLSLVDENGKPANGLLSNSKVASLKVNADLVVLSSCESGLGEEFEGEGTIGIARSFIYAGAKRVITTLWPVDDEATSEFMKNFYRAMFKENASPSAALRQAQLKMRENPKWSSPFFWSAFTIEGEYK